MQYDISKEFNKKFTDSEKKKSDCDTNYNTFNSK
jgi:hypothetical protein